MQCLNCSQIVAYSIYPHVLRCKNCGFIFVDKEERARQQTEFIFKEELDQSVVDHLSKKYPKDFHAKKDLYVRIAKELLLEMSAELENTSIADIGASGGFFLYECEKLAVKKENLYSFEMSPNYIALTEKYFGYTGVQKNIEEVAGEELYDIVTLFDVLEHVSNFDTALSAIHKTLKRGGLLYLKLPSGPSTYLKFKIAQSFGKKSLLSVILYLEPGGHLNYWSRANIHQLEKYGFTILRKSLVRPTKRQFGKKYLVYLVLYKINTLLNTDFYPEFEVVMKKIWLLQNKNTTSLDAIF
jgi:2-polyprenyl-3-methyl-5-hydroxy-6-metoxy-1,4-benzoquinol methylase